MKYVGVPWNVNQIRFVRLTLLPYKQGSWLERFESMNVFNMWTSCRDKLNVSLNHGDVICLRLEMFVVLCCRWSN